MNTANIIDALTLAVAAGVAIFGIIRFSDEKKKDRKATARAHYGQYLLDARENLDLMMGFWPKAKTEKDRIRYRLFVARVMWALEEALLAFDSDDWRECINEQLRFHRDFFETDEFKAHMKTLDPKLVDHLRTYKFVGRRSRRSAPRQR